jgi:uncharacterized OB-fold protein
MPDAEALSDAELVDRFRAVVVDHDTKEFYRGWLEHELRILRCADCGRWQHPPRPMCPACWGWNMVPTPVSGRGTVHLLMRLHQGPPIDGVDYAASPHPVVVVELEEQTALRVTSTVVHCDPATVSIGMPVELAWIQRDGVPFPAFEPAGRA